ncbi:MAG: hypothetical protein HIU90_05725 [Proteobacteria bacterium]|jgi:hypothetical protein|nr:hypothetical protein [Pseudomonadota bacterium]
MEGLFFLAGLFAIVWLAYWVAQEGRGAPGAKRKWSPFDWAEDATPPAVEPGNAVPRRTGASWRDRAVGDRRR